VNDDEQTGQPVDIRPEPTPTEPISIIVLRADIGSSNWAMETENCDAVQLFGAAKLLEMLGMEAFADIRAQSIAEQSRLVTPRGVVPMNREQRRKLS